MSKLPEILKRLRTQKQVYLKEIAPLLNVSIGTVSNYEKGIHTPGPDTLMQLADFYGVSVDYLIGHTDCPCPISTINRSIYGKYTVGRFLWLLDRLAGDDLCHLVYLLELFELRVSALDKQAKKRS